MKLTLRRWALGLGLCASLSSAWAGANSSGGGDILICDVPGFMNGSSYHFADTYGSWANFHKILVTFRGDVNDIVHGVFRQVEQRHPALGAELARAYQKLNFVPRLTIPELEGDMISVPPGCRKKQLAVQDLNSGRVEYSARLLKKLTKIEQALFYIHEAYIQLRWSGPDSRRVRDEVRALSDHQSFEAFFRAVLADRRRTEAPVPEKIFEVASILKKTCDRQLPGGTLCGGVTASFHGNIHDLQWQKSSAIFPIWECRGSSSEAPSLHLSSEFSRALKQKGIDIHWFYVYKIICSAEPANHYQVTRLIVETAFFPIRR